MKNTFYIILLLVVANTGFAQAYHPFPEGEAIWTLQDYYTDEIGYFTYIIQTGDTLINGNTYHKIYKEPHDTTYPFRDTGYLGGLRQNISLKQVYIFLRDDSMERLLYDFSADTINAPFPNTIQKFDSTATIGAIGKTNWGYTGTDSTTAYIYNDTADIYFGGYFYPSIYQGIGAARGGLISKVGEFAAAGTTDYLLIEYIMCFYNGDTLIYNGLYVPSDPSYDCVSPLTVGITALPNGSHLRVSPNPINDYIYITYNDLPAEHRYYFTVYDLLGQALLTQPLAPASTTLPCTNWQAGIYIWEVNDESGNKLTEGKVVKE